jgi:hypothetical protein
MYSKVLLLTATLSAFSAVAVSGAHVMKKTSLQHQFKWVEDAATPTLTYFTVTNMGNGPDDGAGNGNDNGDGYDGGNGDGHSDGHDESHGHGPHPRAHGGWNGDGVLEIQSGWNCDFPNNRTTVPIGRCVRNALAPKGDFMVLLTKPADNGTYALGSQGFLDAHCTMPVGQPFKAQVTDGCWNGIGLHLASRRTPHPMGVTTRVFHKDSCRGGHIDFWVPDNHCGDGALFSHGSKSFVANCENDYVVEYDHEGCMGGTTYHALHGMNLGMCRPTHKATYEVVCGGVPASVWTGPPTMTPTTMSTNGSVYYIDMDAYIKYDGSVAFGQFVRYSFDWKQEFLSSSYNASIWLQTITGNADLSVYYHNPALNSMCDVGVASCVHSTSSFSDMSWEALPYLAWDPPFQTYCSNGCQILIGVYGNSTVSDYQLEIQGGEQFK